MPTQFTSRRQFLTTVAAASVGASLLAKEADKFPPLRERNPLRNNTLCARNS
jgi:hypothetical protein